MEKFTEQSGFTLIEAMVAMLILTIGILSLYTMQVSAIQGNSTASQITLAATSGANQLEDIFAMDYDALVDTDGDSAGGLYDTNNPLNLANGNADGNATTPDGYTIYWNVATDLPMPFTKRVVVSVVRSDRGTLKNVQFEYIKAQVVQR
jgi:type IV pilus modification protein PilV